MLHCCSRPLTCNVLCHIPLSTNKLYTHESIVHQRKSTALMQPASCSAMCCCEHSWYKANSNSNHRGNQKRGALETLITFNSAMFFKQRAILLSDINQDKTARARIMGNLLVDLDKHVTTDTSVWFSGSFAGTYPYPRLWLATARIIGNLLVALNKHVNTGTVLQLLPGNLADTQHYPRL